jgi:hypothetical protein
MLIRHAANGIAWGNQTFIMAFSDNSHEIEDLDYNSHEIEVWITNPNILICSSTSLFIRFRLWFCNIL